MLELVVEVGDSRCKIDFGHLVDDRFVAASNDDIFIIGAVLLLSDRRGCKSETAKKTSGTGYDGAFHDH